MRKSISKCALIFVFLLICRLAAAQSILSSDSTILNRDIFRILEQQDANMSRVTIKQSPHIVSAVNNQILNASQKRIPGYRIRIFFDNKQDARVRSESLERSFPEQFPGFRVYRTFDNPYFKVTVGDFRTRSDATRAFRMLEGSFPGAFIVRENINFPPL